MVYRYMTGLLFKLEKENGGFFCQIWQLVCFYNISKKMNIPIYIDDSEWLFKNNNGWLDYFCNSSLKNIKDSPELSNTLYRHIDDKIRHSFNLQEYKNSITEILRPNKILDERIQKTMIKYDLTKNNFTSIFIRRGDKLYGESKLVITEKYIDTLKNKNINKIFLQTDDYTCYDDFKNNKYIKDNNIQVYTTCPQDKLGAFVFNYQPSIGSKEDKDTDSYLKELGKNHIQKSVKEYSLEEMKEHIEEMLCGLFICLEGEYLVTDYQSNTSRFLALMFNTDNNISVLDEKIPEFNKAVMCPAHGFIEST